MKRYKTMKRRFYALRCYNGMFAAYPVYFFYKRPYKLEMHTFSEDTITKYPWFWTESLGQAERYRDENNAMINKERCAGCILEVVKIEVALKITPGEIEFNRPKTRKVRRKEARHA